MKAMVQERYGTGDVLTLREIDTPTIKHDEVLVSVRAASVHPDVWHVLRGQPRVLRLMGAGLLRPRIAVPGTDVAGVVEAVGRDVTQLKVGDEVFGECVRGHQWQNGGSYAEQVAVRATALTLKPSNVSFEQAAAVPTSGLIAVQGVVDEGQVRAGHKVLINGAAGGVGCFAVQIAKANGAHVTAVDGARKLALLRSLGADRVVDYATEDFTLGQERYDLIVDIPGNHTFAQCRRALTEDGKYVLIGHDGFSDNRRWLGGVTPALKLAALAPFVRELPKMPSMSIHGRMAILRELLESNRLTPVIDKVFALHEANLAIRHLEQGLAVGRLVISIGPR